jgi:hypothetical protein
VSFTPPFSIRLTGNQSRLDLQAVDQGINSYCLRVHPIRQGVDIRRHAQTTRLGGHVLFLGGAGGHLEILQHWPEPIGQVCYTHRQLIRYVVRMSQCVIDNGITFCYLF